jgi:DNA-binding NtrC family response regulator
MRHYPPASITTIFLVEADVTIGELLYEALLYTRGYFVLLFREAAQVLKAVQVITPDLFILAQSPQINGIALHDQLHTRNECADIPTIILNTSLNSVEDELNKRQLVSMSEPFNVDEVLKTVERVLAAKMM